MCGSLRNCNKLKLIKMKIQILAVLSATLLLVSCNQKNTETMTTDENMMMESDTAVVVNDSLMMGNDSTMMHNDSMVRDHSED